MKSEDNKEDKTLLTDSLKEQQLFTRVAELIELARRKVATTANLTMVYTYFEIGREIIENEQEGKERAAYGKFIIKNLSMRLIEKYGAGFSQRNLEQMRKFYQIFSIPQTQSAELSKPNFKLSWSHYLVLMRVANPAERSFYEIETAANQWSEKELLQQKLSEWVEEFENQKLNES